MKPWIFWEGKVPSLDKTLNGELVTVRIVVVEHNKYVVEQQMGRGALGEVWWMDAYNCGEIDPAKLLETCLLDLITRRNALGWIPRDEMPAEPHQNVIPQISAIEPTISIEPSTTQIKSESESSTEIILEHSKGNGTLYKVGSQWRLRDANGNAHTLATNDLEQAQYSGLRILNGEIINALKTPWKKTDLVEPRSAYNLSTEAIHAALKSNNGNMTAAAKSLNVTYQSFYGQIKTRKIDVEQYLPFTPEKASELKIEQKSEIEPEEKSEVEELLDSSTSKEVWRNKINPVKEIQKQSITGRILQHIQDNGPCGDVRLEEWLKVSKSSIHDCVTKLTWAGYVTRVVDGKIITFTDPLPEIPIPKWWPTQSQKDNKADNNITKEMMNKNTSPDRRVILALGKLGPQPFDRLAGMLLLNTKLLSDTLTKLISQNLITKLGSGFYSLNE